MPLTPSVISKKGDWFLQTRLPEFSVNWRDPQFKIHHLEIVGRHLRCQTHDDPALAGFIHPPNADGGYALACLELQVHWPRLFTSGLEFVDLRAQRSGELRIGRLRSLPHSTPMQAHHHIAASMIYHLAQAKVRRLGSSLPQDSFYSSTEKLQDAAEALSQTPGLGTLSQIATPQLEQILNSALTPENHLTQINDHLLIAPTRRWNPQLAPASFSHLVHHWHYPENWVESTAAPSDLASSLTSSFELSH